jgi:ribosomal protein S27AE
MEIQHRVAFNGDTKPGFKAVLDERGIRYGVAPLPGHTVGLVYFDMLESDPHWPAVQALIRTHGASNIFNSFFTRQEILAAEWVRLEPAFEQGYPQPKASWEQVTYAQKCPRCGAGFVQKAPFHLAKEPHLGKRDFFCLYWTYTLFCAPRVVAALRGQPFTGYEVWSPVLHRTGEPAQTVSQLVFPGVAAPGLEEVDRARPEACPQCGGVKYAPHLRGYLHLRRQALRADTDFQLTHEWFGSGGHGGYREVLVSHRVAQLALEEGWRGIALKPVILT